MGATEQRKLAAIMFTDMVGYSALTQRDEALALELLEEHLQILRDILPMFQGNEIKSTGDGLLVEFASALAAVQCAIEIQRTLAERNEKKSEERQIQIRIGIHLGDVVKRGSDVLGDGVNIAARIEPLAEPGGICVTRAVFEQIENKVPQPCVQLSKPELKNISANVEVYKLVLGATPADLQTAVSSRKQLQWLVLGVVVVNVILFMKFGVDRKSTESTTNSPASILMGTNADQKSIAVLAFANLSDDMGNEYFSDGISEELLNVLAKVPGLKVSARTSAFSFKGKNASIKQIAQELGVAYVVEGSVRKSGSRVRITAQLIKAADGFHIWSDTFDRELKDVFAVQDEIAGLVAKNLQLNLGANRAAAGTENLEAYRLYLEGRAEWNRRTPAGFDRAEVFLNQALELDPKFARAHAALADVWSMKYAELEKFGTFATRNSAESQRVLAKAEQALALDPQCAEAHAALGHACLLTFRFEEAERPFRKAVELNPNYATGQQWLGVALSHLGYPDESLARLQRAAELDPLSHRILDNYAEQLKFVGRLEDAWAMLERARSLNPDGVQIRVNRLWLLVSMGRKTEALALARDLAADPNDLGADKDVRQAGFRLSAAIAALATFGATAEAEALLPNLRPGSYDRVVSLVYLHRVGEAVLNLDDITSWRVLDLFNEPHLDQVRLKPEFQAWVDKTGLRTAHDRAQTWRKSHPVGGK